MIGFHSKPSENYKMNLLINILLVFLLGGGVALVSVLIHLFIGAPRIIAPLVDEPLQELRIDTNAIWARYGAWLKRKFDRFELDKYNQSLTISNLIARQRFLAVTKNWYNPLGACLACMSNWLAVGVWVLVAIWKKIAIAKALIIAPFFIAVVVIGALLTKKMLL